MSILCRIIGLGVVLAFVATSAGAQESSKRLLEISEYQDESGAIAVHVGGDGTDPYFAAKALLLARDGGMDITIPGRAFVQWLLKQQKKDGHFSRYCRDQGDWKACNTADADDSMLALWLELLYALAPASGLPPSWHKSASLAERQLKEIYDPETGIYHISKTLPVGLLMDNTEVYWAYISIANEAERLGRPKEAAAWQRKAARLARHIRSVFWDAPAQHYRITTQERSEEAFYPDKLAQVFPWLYLLPVPKGVQPRNAWREWLRANREAWLNAGMEDYPWGLMAVAALSMDDANTAACWKERSAPLRGTIHWNVLEEAALQQVQWQLQFLPARANPCGEN